MDYGAFNNTVVMTASSNHKQGLQDFHRTVLDMSKFSLI